MTFLELDNREFVRAYMVVNVFKNPFSHHGLHRMRRDLTLSKMCTQEVKHGSGGLEIGRVQAPVDPVRDIRYQRDVLLDDVSDSMG